MTDLVCKLCGQKGGMDNGVFRNPESPFNETLGCPNPKCNGNQDVITQEEFNNKTEILVKGYLIDDDNKVVDIIEGNLPKEQANTFQEGGLIDEEILRAKNSKIDDPNSKTTHTIRAKYRIITREELISEVDTPYIKITLKQN